MATSVATVPAVKRAVHHVTKPHAAKPRPRLTRAAMPARQVPCAPITGGNGLVSAPIVPLVSFAAPIPDEPLSSIGRTANPGGGGLIPTGSSPIGGLPGGGGGGGLILPPTTAPIGPVAPVPTPTPTATPTDPVGTTPTPLPTSTPGVIPPGLSPPVINPIGPVPEPSMWAMLIVGFGLLGAGLRRRRRSVARPRRSLTQMLGLGGFLSGAAPLAAGDVVAGVTAKSATSAVAGKVMLCVCPAALVAGTVMTVPPVRSAVHGITGAAPVRAVPVAPACDDTAVPAAVPVAAAASPTERPAG